VCVCVCVCVCVVVVVVFVVVVFYPTVTNYDGIIHYKTVDYFQRGYS
jgi:hypothetical protein